MGTLYILWTTDNILTVRNMIFMYATNSKIHNWWDEVVVIIWGAAAKLAAENDDIKDSMDIAMHAGVKFSACVACARQLGVADELTQRGVELLPWGKKLTELIQNGEKILTV